MKKVLAGMASVAVVCGLAACTPANNSTTASTTGSAATTQAATSQAEAETVVYKDLALKIPAGWVGGAYSDEEEGVDDLTYGYDVGEWSYAILVSDSTADRQASQAESNEAYAKEVSDNVVGVVASRIVNELTRSDINGLEAYACDFEIDRSVDVPTSASSTEAATTENVELSCVSRFYVIFTPSGGAYYAYAEMFSGTDISFATDVIESITLATTTEAATTE